MKKITVFILLLAFSVIAYPISAYTQTLTLDKMLGKLTARRTTTLERTELVATYKGQAVKGIGRVKDVMESVTSENKATVYLERLFRGNAYEIVLAVNKEDVQNIRKGKKVRFEGTFVGMSFKTLRFDDATLVKRAWFLF